MTANAFKEDEQATADAGMQAHIAKPIDVGTLMKTLRTVLQRPKE
jgi:CheY-like chemotaxis protein